MSRGPQARVCAVPLAHPAAGTVAWRALLRLYLHSRAAPLRTDVSAGSRPISLVGVPCMATATRKTDLSPLEAIVVENTLGDYTRRNRRDSAIARIQLLTKERQKLYAKSAAHPLLSPANGPRIRAIAAEIEPCWRLLRRERGTRR